MDVSVKQNRQLRSMGLALAISIVATVATMFVPASALESITGASGLSELIPATAAPLGDTARALTAFGAGAVILALMTVLLLRRNSASPAAATVAVPAAGMTEGNDRDFASSLSERIATLRLPRMPWVKGDNDITDLADLPKLRGGDSHPDAPPRRPLSATQDLPVLELTEMATEPVVSRAKSFEPASTAQPFAPDTQPTLAEMIEQLEASVAQRQQQLAELETVAADLAMSKAPVAVEVNTVEPEASVAPACAQWRPLEAVPSSTDQPDEMDDALAAALATLHRMNGTGR